MSFWSKIFGGQKQEEPEERKREKAIQYKGMDIVAAPIKEPDGQWRLAGFIVHLVNGDQLEREFIRAEVFGSREDAIEFSISKAQQVVDQMGEKLFADGKPSGRA